MFYVALCAVKGTLLRVKGKSYMNMGTSTYSNKVKNKIKH